MSYKQLRFLNFLVIIVVISYLSACNQNKELLDPQGNKYETITIGSLEWMTKNLEYDVGDGSYCYDNDSINCYKMGRLYTWEAAIKASEKIPGWHLPSKQEWQELINFCGDDSLGYFNIISEEIGFKPQWSGVRVSTGEFKAINFKTVNYWSSTLPDTNATLAYSVAIMSNFEIISLHNYPKINACSVRLVKDR